MITTIVIFIVILGLLVFVHELGHFLVAKRSGMKVDEFGFGFPPRAIGIQKHNGTFSVVWGHKQPKNADETVYSINWIPLGGFVKIVGENNEDAQNPNSFIHKPFFPRLLTLIAGVLMNVILAWILISVGFMVGLPVAATPGTDLGRGAKLSNPQVAIIDVKKDFPGSKAGLQVNDIIVSIDGQQMTAVDSVQNYVKSHQGDVLTFEVKRGDLVTTMRVESLASPPEGTGPTGIALADIGLLSYPWYSAIIQGATTTVQQLWGILVGLYSLFSSGQGFDSLGGPAKIAQLTGQVADLGFAYLIQFTAFLSLNLAILNILPFPALDGGRVLFLIIEKVRGKRNNQNIEQFANTAGFLLLLLLMVLVTINDIRGFGGVGTVVRKIFGG